MGQNSSQLQHPEDEESDRDLKPATTSSPPDIQFSSQIPPSTDPLHPPMPQLGQQLRARFSPSRRSSMPPPPPRPKAPSPFQKSTDTHTPTTNSNSQKKKKRRSKNRSSSVSQQSDDRRPFIPHSSLDLEAPNLQAAATDDFSSEANEANSSIDYVPRDLVFDGGESPASLNPDKDMRRQQKRERKEQKRATKLAKLAQQQSEADPSPSQDPPSSRFADIWEAQENFPAKFEPVDENEGLPEDSMLETHESPKSRPESSKKRKRKSRDRIKLEPQPGSGSGLANGINRDTVTSSDPLPEPDNPEGSAIPSSDGPRESKKRRLRSDSSASGKKNQRKTSSVEKHTDTQLQIGDGDIQVGDIDETEANAHDRGQSTKRVKKAKFNQLIDEEGDDLSQIAESLYSARKNRSNFDYSGALHESPSRSRPNTDIIIQTPHDEVEPATDDELADSVLETHGSAPEAPKTKALDDNDAMVVVGDDQSNHEHEHNGDEDNDDDYADDDNRSDGSSKDSHSAMYEAADNSSVGVTKFEAPESEEWDHLGFHVPVLAPGRDKASTDRHSTSGDAEPSDSVMDEEVEVPSSIPRRHSTSSKGAQVDTSGTKSSSKRKRVPKPVFNTESLDDTASPTEAAVSRRKFQDSQLLASDDSATAGTSRAAALHSQPKISTTLKAQAGITQPESSPSATIAFRTPQKTVRDDQYRKGNFTDSEIRALGQRIERWRDDNNMTQYAVNKLIHRHPHEAREFWDSVVIACPDRKQQSVFNICRRKWHNFVARGTWTAEQHQELVDLWKKLGSLQRPPYTQMAKEINRLPEDVRDRMRNYVFCGDKRRQHFWDQAEEEKLLELVQEAKTHIHNYFAERGLPPDATVDVDFAEISRKMGTRSRLQCISKWKTIKAQMGGKHIDGESSSLDELIPKARREANAMIPRDRYRVIKTILNSRVDADSRIPWGQIRSKLDRQWFRPTLAVVWLRLKRAVADNNIMTVPEICNELIKTYQQDHALEFPEDLDMQSEWKAIEHLVKRMVPSNANVKSVSRAVESDRESDGEDDQLGEEDANANIGPVSSRLRHSSVDLGMDRQRSNRGANGDGEDEIQDSEPDVSAEAGARSKSPFRKQPSQDAPSISDFQNRKAKKSMVGYGSARKALKAATMTPKQRKQADQSDAPRDGERVSTQKRLSSKSSAKHKRSDSRPVIHDDDLEEQSSDTNASDVESIPAR